MIFFYPNVGLCDRGYFVESSNDAIEVKKNCNKLLSVAANQECVCSIVSFICNVYLCASLKKSSQKDLYHTEMLSNFKETEPTVQRYSVKKVTDDRRLTERVPADPPRNLLN